MHTLRRNSSCRAMMPHGLERLLRCTQRPKLIQVPRFQNPIPLPFDRRPSTCQPLPTQALRLAPSQRQALPCPALPSLARHHPSPIAPHHTSHASPSALAGPCHSYIMLLQSLLTHSSWACPTNFDFTHSGEGSHMSMSGFYCHCYVCNCPSDAPRCSIQPLI